MRKIELSKEILIRQNPLRDTYFLMNTKTGYIFEIGLVEYQNLQNILGKFSKTLNAKEETSFEKMGQLGIFKGSQTKSSFVNETISNKSEPFHIQLHLTNNCNLRCRHCYQENYSKNEEMSKKQVFKFIDHSIKAIKKWGKLPEFSLTGGEPLLRKDLIEIIKHIKSREKNSLIYILTNGTLMTERMAKKLKNTGVTSIQLSIEGSNNRINDSIRGKGTFQKILNAVEILKGQGLRVSFHFVLSSKNKKDLFKVIKLANSLNINAVTVSQLVPIGRGKKMKKLMVWGPELKRIFQKLDLINKKNQKANKLPLIRTTRPLLCTFKKQKGIGGCTIGLNSLTVLPNGDVLPCRRLPITIGNIKRESLFTIWYGSDLLWDIRNRKNITGCNKCQYLESCGGCRALAYAFSGDYLKKDPTCWL